MRRKRNAFVVHPAPTKPMSTRRRPPTDFDAEPPPDLLPIVAWWQMQPDARERFRWALRDSVDELLDGERTGHWCYQHFGKTEKTHLGTVIEINLAKEFSIPQGKYIDWSVGGVDLDCKFSKDVGGWEIPMEMYLCAYHHEQSGKANHPALLVWLDDDNSQWAAGIVRVTDSRLKFRHGGAEVRQYNRDNKRHLSDIGMDAIYWLWGGCQNDLPENVLRHMDASSRTAILDANLSGQKRVNELFKRQTGKLLSRHVINTVAQQDDAPKRARDARLPKPRGIRSDGYLVLGHQESHPQIADALGLPPPEKGEWVSVRVAQVDQDSDRKKVKIGSTYWAEARPGDTIGAAPEIPRGRLDE
jgi:hypothetical protein